MSRLLKRAISFIAFFAAFYVLMSFIIALTTIFTPKLEDLVLTSPGKAGTSYQRIDELNKWLNETTPGSKGLMLVDRAIEGVFRDMEECVFLNSDDPHDLVAQIHDILNNYKQYERIRDKGYKLAHTVYSSQALATRMLKAIGRVIKVTHGETWLA